MTSSRLLLLFAVGCGPNVMVEADWAVGEYSDVGFVGSLIDVDNSFIFGRYVVLEDGTGTYVGEQCGTVLQTQEFEWRSESDSLIRLVPVDGADAFENLPNTSFLLHRATECIDATESRLAVYFVERLYNGDFEGGAGQEQPLYRTNPCATSIPAPSPCPDDTECGPGPCELSWCDDEAPEPCDLDD